MVDFHHKKGIDMLDLGCTLPNLTNNCLHNSTTANFHPYTENGKDLLEKIREEMVSGPSIVVTRKAVVDETFFWDSTNWCKTIVEIDSSQVYLSSVCQAMPNGLYTKWDLDSQSGYFKPMKTRLGVLKTWSFHAFSDSDHSVKWKVSI